MFQYSALVFLCQIIREGIQIVDSQIKDLTEDSALNYAAYLLADENGVSIKVAKYSSIAGKPVHQRIYP